MLHRDWRYAVLAWLARVAIRRGFWSPASDRFLTHPYRPGSREHHEDQYLGVVGGDAAVEVRRGALWRFAAGEREAAMGKAQRLGLGREARPLVAIGPGGGRNVKMAVDLKLWGVQSYEELAARLDDEGYQVVWLGDAHDAAMLSDDVPGVRLAGRLSVAESAAVVSACRLVVTNDTMLLHLARVLEVPALGIFGPTDPAHTGPRGEGSAHLWLGPDLVPCSPCHRDGFYPVCTFDHRCMKELPVDLVARTASALLKAAAGRKLAVARSP